MCSVCTSATSNHWEKQGRNGRTLVCVQSTLLQLLITGKSKGGMGVCSVCTPATSNHWEKQGRNGRTLVCVQSALLQLLITGKSKGGMEGHLCVFSLHFCNF